MSQSLSLGHLTVVPPREVWPHEALNFAPWLLANVEVLSDLLGMDLAPNGLSSPSVDLALI